MGGAAEMMQSAGFRPASEDAMGVRDYLQSHDAVAALRQRVPLVDIFRRPEADPVARLWWAAPNAERLLDYFRRMATAEYDTTSGITALRVRSFRAGGQQGHRPATPRPVGGAGERAERPAAGRRTAGGAGEVTRAEARLTAAQLGIGQFRARERAVDPTRSAGLAIENIGKLEGALAQARAELAEAQRFARADNPRLLQLRNRAEGLVSQIAEERQRLGSRTDGVSQQVGEFERLSVERELATASLPPPPPRWRRRAATRSGSRSSCCASSSRTRRNMPATRRPR